MLSKKRTSNADKANTGPEFAFEKLLCKNTMIVVREAKKARRERSSHFAKNIKMREPSYVKIVASYRDAEEIVFLTLRRS